MKILTLLAGSLLAVAMASGQDAPPLTLGAAVDEALAHGADQQVLSANLAAARAAAAAALAKAGLALGAGLSYGASETWNSPARPLVTSGASADPLVSSVGTVTKDAVVPQSAGATLTLGTPSTSLSLKGTQNLQVAPSGALNTTTAASATLTQVLWNGYLGGPLQAAADKAVLQARTAEATAQANRNKVALSVKQAYFTLLSAQEGIAQLTLAVDQRAAALRFVQAKFEVQQVTGLDLKTAQLNARSAQLDLDAGRSALEVARRRLANLLGRSAADSLTVAQADDPEVGAATVDEAVAAALSNRVEIRSALGTAAAAQVDRDAALGALVPSFTLTGGLSFAKDNQTQKLSNVGSVALTMNTPALDAGSVAGLIDQTQAALRAAEIQVSQLRRSIPVDVIEAWNTWTVARQRYDVAVSQTEVAEGSLAIVKAQFEAGLKGIADEQTAELALSAAQQAQIKAKISYQVAALQVQALMGL